MAGTYEQSIAFGVDNAGLERFLRFFHSAFMILTAWPSMIARLMPLSPPSVHMSTETALFQLQGQLNLARRWTRLFRFLEAYQAGWNLFLSENKGLDTWLDVISKTCFGMFGMLETVTILDMLGVDHLEVFGREQFVDLNLQAQKFWFVALYASILSTAVKLLRILAYRPVPETGGGYGTGENAVQSAYAEKDSDKDPAEVAEKETSEEEKLVKERERMKEIVEKRKLERKAWAVRVGQESTALGLKLIADVLDLVIAASNCGWIKIDVGLVGTAMLFSTVITGNEIYKRCGREIAQKKA